MSENEGSTSTESDVARRFLTPSQKYEIWLRLVRQEDDRRGGGHRAGGPVHDHPDPDGGQGRCVGGAGRLQARGGRQAARLRAGAGPGRGRPAFGGVQGARGEVDVGRGKRRLGLSGRVPLAALDLAFLSRMRDPVTACGSLAGRSRACKPVKRRGRRCSASGWFSGRFEASKTFGAGASESLVTTRRTTSSAEAKSSRRSCLVAARWSLPRRA